MRPSSSDYGFAPSPTPADRPRTPPARRRGCRPFRRRRLPSLASAFAAAVSSAMAFSATLSLAVNSSSTPLVPFAGARRAIPIGRRSRTTASTAAAGEGRRPSLAFVSSPPPSSTSVVLRAAISPYSRKRPLINESRAASALSPVFLLRRDDRVSRRRAPTAQTPPFVRSWTPSALSGSTNDVGENDDDDRGGGAGDGDSSKTNDERKLERAYREAREADAEWYRKFVSELLDEEDPAHRGNENCDGDYEDGGTFSKYGGEGGGAAGATNGAVRRPPPETDDIRGTNADVYADDEMGRRKTIQEGRRAAPPPLTTTRKMGVDVVKEEAPFAPPSEEREADIEKYTREAMDQLPPSSSVEMKGGTTRKTTSEAEGINEGEKVAVVQIFDGEVGSFVDAARLEELTELGYSFDDRDEDGGGAGGKSEIETLRSEALELILEDSIPRPTRGVPRQWTILNGEREAKGRGKREREVIIVRRSSSDNKTPFDPSRVRGDPVFDGGGGGAKGEENGRLLRRRIDDAGGRKRNDSDDDESPASEHHETSPEMLEKSGGGQRSSSYRSPAKSGSESEVEVEAEARSGSFSSSYVVRDEGEGSEGGGDEGSIKKREGKVKRGPPIAEYEDIGREGARWRRQEVRPMSSSLSTSRPESRQRDGRRTADDEYDDDDDAQTGQRRRTARGQRIRKTSVPRIPYQDDDDNGEEEPLPERRRRRSRRPEGNERRRSRRSVRELVIDRGDRGDDGDNPPQNKFWMDLPTFQDYLRTEAQLRLKILGPDWRESVLDESQWRFDLYKKWLYLLDEGIGENPLYADRRERGRIGGEDSRRELDALQRRRRRQSTGGDGYDGAAERRPKNGRRKNEYGTVARGATQEGERRPQIRRRKDSGARRPPPPSSGRRTSSGNGGGWRNFTDLEESLQRSAARGTRHERSQRFPDDADDYGDGDYDEERSSRVSSTGRRRGYGGDKYVDEVDAGVPAERKRRPKRANNERGEYEKYATANDGGSSTDGDNNGPRTEEEYDQIEGDEEEEEEKKKRPSQSSPGQRRRRRRMEGGSYDGERYEEVWGPEGEGDSRPPSFSRRHDDNDVRGRR